MKAIKWILQWARGKNYGAMYGNPAHINVMMSDTDYATCADNTAVFCHLITNSETSEGHDRSTIGVFFSRLCDFDFDPENLLDVQQDLQEIAKTMLADMTADNVIGYEEPVRWQYGYDDYADNVAWVCCRVTCEVLAADCVPYTPPPPPPKVTAHDDVTQGWVSVMGYTPLTDGFGGYCNSFMWIGISEDSLSSFTYTINGGEELPGQIGSSMIVDDGMIEVMPFMAPYEGKYLIITLGYSVPEGDADVEVTMDGEVFKITYDFSTICG